MRDLLTNGHIIGNHIDPEYVQKYLIQGTSFACGTYTKSDLNFNQTNISNVASITCGSINTGVNSVSCAQVNTKFIGNPAGNLALTIDPSSNNVTFYGDISNANNIYSLSLISQYISCPTITSSASISTPVITSSNANINFSSKNLSNVGSISCGNITGNGSGLTNLNIAGASIKK